jgi:uncharacterized membrane protein YdjX (TVP38/TMEM64 family)
MPNNQKNTIFKFGIIAILVIGLIIIAYKFGLFQYISTLLNNANNWIESLGTTGGIIFILIYINATALLISGAVLTLGAGLIFGVIKGSILVSIASTLGATISFLIGRYLLRNWVEKQIEKQPNFKAIDAAVAKEGWKIVGLTRLSPLFPFVFLNYAFGVTKVSLKDYILASWIGMMPGTVMYVYIGYIGQSASQGNSLKLALNIIGLISTIAVTIYVTKIAKQALNYEIKIEG